MSIAGTSSSESFGSPLVDLVIWLAVSCSFSILANSLGMAALPLRMTEARVFRGNMRGERKLLSPSNHRPKLRFILAPAPHRLGIRHLAAAREAPSCSPTLETKIRGRSSGP